MQNDHRRMPTARTCRSERPRAGGGAVFGRDIRCASAASSVGCRGGRGHHLGLRVWVAPSRVRPRCPRAASDCVGRSRDRRFVDPGASAPVRRARAPVGGMIGRSHSTCVGVYCLSVVPGRYRLCCRAPPPWRPATPPGRPARRRRGHLPRWTRPEPNRRGYCSGLLRGDGNCSCSRHGRAESSPWSTQSSVLQGDSVCAVECVGSALAPGAVSWSVACADELTVKSIRRTK